MKNLKKLGFIVTLMGVVLFNVGCGEDNEALIVTDPKAEFDGELAMAEGDTDKSIDISVDATTKTAVDVKVTFTSTAKSMKRLYITQNIGGQGDEPYELTGNVDNKADGSLDIAAGNSNVVTYKLSLPVPSSISEGTVVYRLWATSGRGDYRDHSKRLVVGVGSITLTYGGANAAAAVKSYTAKMFAVPLADGTSNTFISVLDGNLYKLSDGEEYASFWDFGYYWLDSPGASLASTAAYPSLFDHDNDAGTPLVAIAELTGTDAAELNNCYFATSAMTSTEFDAVAVSGDLSSLAVSTADAEKIMNLTEGDIIAFIDTYGNKGLIRVVTIVSGYGSNGAMTIDIKVQP